HAHRHRGAGPPHRVRGEQLLRRACRHARPCRGRRMSPRQPVPAAENGNGEESHVVVAFDDNRLIPELFGEFDQNLARIEQRLGVYAVARGNQVTFRGSAEDTGRARRALDILYARLQRGHDLTQGDVDGAIRMAEAPDDQPSLPTLEPKGRLAMATVSTRRRTVMA